MPRPLLAAVTVVLALSSGAAAAPPPNAAPPPAAAPTVEYVLSVDLAGDPTRHAAALAALAEGLPPLGADTPWDGGALVGRAPDLPAALAWIAAHVFGGATASEETLRLSRGAAPIPGGALLHEHGTYVRAFVVSIATPDGSPQAPSWPAEQSELLPESLAGWIGAALAVDAAPLFAAPAPTVPAASERHAMAYRDGGLFVLGFVDRCDDARQRCLRWAQVVARSGNRFVGGYLPAYLVARQDAWIRGEGALPRAQLIRSGTVGRDAALVLLARDRAGELHRTRVLVPLVDGGFPEVTLRVRGDQATLDLPGGEHRDIALDARMDLRIRD